MSILTKHALTNIVRENDKTFLLFNNGEKRVETERVIITTGGHPKSSSFDYLARLGHEISAPVPSLFTFNINDKNLRSLMGTVVDNATIGIVGEKMRGEGPLLITHWGMSGPAVLKLSSYAAPLQRFCKLDRRKQHLNHSRHYKNYSRSKCFQICHQRSTTHPQ